MTRLAQGTLTAQGEIVDPLEADRDGAAIGEPRPTDRVQADFGGRAPGLRRRKHLRRPCVAAFTRARGARTGERPMLDNEPRAANGRAQPAGRRTPRRTTPTVPPKRAPAERRAAKATRPPRPARSRPRPRPAAGDAPPAEAPAEGPVPATAAAEDHAPPAQARRGRRGAEAAAEAAARSYRR